MADNFADNDTFPTTKSWSESEAALQYPASEKDLSSQQSSTSCSSRDSSLDVNTDDPLTETARKQKADKSNEAATPQPPTRRFDPTALLNPKAATSAKRARENGKSKDVQSNHSISDGAASDGDNGTPGVGSMIERMHGVTNREAAPQKRRKMDDADSEDGKKHKGQFTGGTKVGPISEYMQKKRDEGQAEAGPPLTPNGAIDLTADDDDDDVMVVSATGPDLNKEVCLGMINTMVMAYRVPSASNAVLDRINQDKWPPSRINLVQDRAVPMKINCIDKNQAQFGMLEFKTASVLSVLLTGRHINKIRFQGFLAQRDRLPGENPGDHISKAFNANIYVYAPRSKVELIGKTLSQKQVFLYEPLGAGLERDKEIVNPHVPKTDYIPKASILQKPPQFAGAYTIRTVEEIRNDVQTMFDTLQSAEDLPELEPNMSLLNTKLMPHQKQALYFLMKQETQKVLDATSDEGTNPLWKAAIKKDLSKIWYNVITGQEVKVLQPSLGGLFADLMGLGKTLSILSLICSTIVEARTFGDEALPDELEATRAERNTRATLIVCPKSVLSNWDEQIKAHLKRNKINYYSYHGSKREQDLDELDQYDIVITSYTTVNSEYSFSNSQYKALGKLNWFRIVLDEAHMIRNQTTGVYKATCALHSKRRWAVTGTPVQNRLDDLGALIKFIQVKPFDDATAWDKFVMAPFKNADPQALNNLRLLVDSITLRRGKEKIDLPDRKEMIVELEFDEAERALYEAFARDSRQRLKAMTSTRGLGGKGYAHVLASITRLRLICVHGKDLLSTEDLKLLEGQTYASAIDLGDEDDDNKHVLSEEQLYSMFHLLRDSGMNSCSRCMKEIGAVTYDAIDEDPDRQDLLGYMTPCYQVICSDCIDEFNKEVNARKTVDNYAKCPICEQYIKASFSPLYQSKLDADIERRQDLRRNPRSKNDGNYSGPHTKVKALITDLHAHQAASAVMGPGEPPIRSVVFSGWTGYLDLIEIALNDAGITFLRLDGKMSVSARSRVLEQFRTDPEVTVILVSIKAGGQGLNFTAANKVYMMEPQFNPGVESQAIDRVHRLGQKRDVEIKRYIMKDSFEEKVVELQKKKLELAKTAMAKGKLSKGDAAKKKLEDLRSLFR